MTDSDYHVQDGCHNCLYRLFRFRFDAFILHCNSAQSDQCGQAVQMAGVCGEWRQGDEEPGIEELGVAPRQRVTVRPEVTRPLYDVELTGENG